MKSTLLSLALGCIFVAFPAAGQEGAGGSAVSVQGGSC